VTIRFDAENEAVQQNHFSESAAGAKGLQTPFETLHGEALVHDLIEGIEEGPKSLEDGAADGRAHDGEKRIGERAGILANRFAHRGFDGGSECFAERVATSVLATKLDGFGNDRADILSARFGIGDALM
jgi:hypothetical protein